MNSLFWKRTRLVLFAGMILLPLFSLLTNAAVGEDSSTVVENTVSPTVLWARYHGVIGTVSASFLEDAVAEAEAIDAECVVIELDTPGGLDTSMRVIVKKILASEIPVVLYVSPSGSRATSAGVFIALSANVVAMAPGTNMGAAHPVNIGGGSDSTMIHKATNDAVAYIRSIAEERERDADWAEETVRNSISASANEAVKLGVADFIAADREALFDSLQGRVVTTAAGERTLDLENADVNEFSMSKRYRFLSILNDPNAAYLLLLLGFYGIFFELSSPGSIYPGVIGAICLVLGLFALQSFSINYAGLLLMVLGTVFFILELITPTFGVLTAGGVAALTIGSILLFRSPEPFLRVSLKVIVPAMAFTSLFFIFAISMVIRTRKKKVAVGRRALIGLTGKVRSRIDPCGKVFLNGMHWTAESDEAIEEGEIVIVESVTGLTLRVRKSDSYKKEV